jgi:hypothetical protein
MPHLPQKPRVFWDVLYQLPSFSDIYIPLGQALKFQIPLNPDTQNAPRPPNTQKPYGFYTPTLFCSGNSKYY